MKSERHRTRTQSYGLHKTVAIFEGRHVETVEKMKEVTALASNIQGQVKEQEQKMVKQVRNQI